jgi:hypothetical protein
LKREGRIAPSPPQIVVRSLSCFEKKKRPPSSSSWFIINIWEWRERETHIKLALFNLWENKFHNCKPLYAPSPSSPARL